MIHGQVARVRCDHCQHEYLLAFSCKGRWFCPSCHQKEVQLFGALLTEAILFPVPHRHFTFGIHKMLRPYFHPTATCSLSAAQRVDCMVKAW
jgi:NAD-dependent SIR2 family protein deacetylase